MIERRLVELGRSVVEEVCKYQPSIFDGDFYTGKLLEWAMVDDEFRVALFRFVDVLPSLADASAVIEHAQAYFRPVAHKFPGLTKWGLDLDPDSLLAKAAAGLVRQQIRSLAEGFILGETPEKYIKALRNIRKNGLAFTVDLLGEAVVSELESEEYLQRFLELFEVLGRAIPTWKEATPLIYGHLGERSLLHVSVKLSALYSQIKPVAFDLSVQKLSDRLAVILNKARELSAFVTVDMEDSSKTEITLATFQRVLESAEFRDYDRAGIALQAYLRRTAEDLQQLLGWVRIRGTPIHVRLVKGAYWDSETILARLAGWPIPVWQVKSASDVAYERLTEVLLEQSSLVYPCFASHNIRSLCHALACAEAQGVPPTAFELQTIYGMAEPIKIAFAKRGYLVREYAPIGDMLTGMSYLGRRLLENTSNHAWVQRGLQDKESIEILLRPPWHASRVRPEEISGAVEEAPQWRPRQEFRNYPLTDFSRASEREALRKMLAEIRARLAAKPEMIYPIIDGLECKRVPFTATTQSPEEHGLVLGKVANATLAELRDAQLSLAKAFPAWRDTPVQERAEVLYRVAEILIRRRVELTAWIILETGKPWGEADADVAEAIDFCNYYAGQAIRLFAPQSLCPWEGEEDYYFQEPRGLCAVISPWNFPLAIPCGMLAAALVTGNGAVLKPAEQSPLVARELFRIFLEAGLPSGVAAFLPGLGELIGEALVTSPQISTIAFTGSKAVGLRIIEKASHTLPGQEHVKRTICEMGGKNAIIVDGDADLEQAVRGVISSVFGYAGQKCSACSRLLVVESAYERFCARLAAAVASLSVGPASDPATVVGPLINAEARSRVEKAIAFARVNCRLLAEKPVSEEQRKRGYFVAPTLFAEVPLDHPLMKEELFGPVAAVSKLPTFEAALQAANASEYGLTGAVFSRNPAHLRKAAREFRVGNLYLNRGCTGALVGRQPFGGAKMSGVGSKAGGPDYLLQFTIPRVVCENTLRQGFAPMKSAFAAKSAKFFEI